MARPAPKFERKFSVSRTRGVAMWTRVNGMTVSRFKKDEDGAILVFFALCCAAIFLVAALSFDIGRRASTQTEIQSFTDHVALAAAGELNGFPGAIQRAKAAADQLILDEYVIGDGDKVLGPGDFQIYFYETLPDDDEEDLGIAVGQTNPPLSDTDPASDALARFVRVALLDDGTNDTRITVPWVFARLLTIFGTNTLPSELIGAESVAGYTSLACDVSPVFFCMPEGNSLMSGEPWDPADHIGQTIRLRDGDGGGGQGGPYWEPGNFTWLDIREQVPDTVVDLDGPCQGLSGNNLYECLFAAEGGATLCFENGLLTTLPGQKEGNVAAVFDTRFDIYSSSSSQVADDPTYRPAPVVNKAYEADGVCGSGQTSTTTTMALPPDDCFKSTAADPFGTCGNYSGELRYGNADWEDGRLKYVETNYSRDFDSTGTILSGDITTGGEMMTIAGEEYHRDDPFRPEAVYGTDYTAQDLIDAGLVQREADGTPSVDGAGNQIPDPDQLTKTSMINRNLPAGATPVDYSNFPIIPNGSTKWDYYQAEVAGSLYQVPNLVFNLDPDNTVDTFNDEADGASLIVEDISGPGEEAVLVPRPRELIRDIEGPTNYDRLGSTNPYCSRVADESNFSLDPRRRTLVAAAVDCGAQKISGKTTDVRATYFVEVFLISPSDDDPVDKKKKEIFVEIIGPALNTGETQVRPGRFRNLVQLYRNRPLGVAE
ncbi:hypothetical protein GQ651_06675 [Alphaproteobacteria bacterium GH1-50]|uniref:Putative Flp pilus-assembly TadG-like N-terminal domain-containing protein n=1 Tax=Kangsaoukella pontilimi TaxID=2691042 RepID=A0A7C9IFG2_9RHOB|nr:Tad domain-containing protein [Kangsaoukella pontilimi]MXQ07528.1 hypothetical protein [Kangsaoukella pontilimi]